MLVKMSKEKAIGQIFENKYGRYEVVAYESARKVQVRWQDYSCDVWCQWHDAVRGNVKNPMYPSIFGVGYFGVGPYFAYAKNSKIIEKSYSCWKAMLQRCYDNSPYNQWDSYRDCSVEPFWHNYQNFAKWYLDNYKEDHQLDKDILVKGSRTYGPDVCLFVPTRINRLFIRNKSCRGGLPIGVHMKQKVTPRYLATCANIDGVVEYLGTYNTPTEAFLVYKNFKESVIKQVAEQYKDKIPELLYNILVTYQVAQDD